MGNILEEVQVFVADRLNKDEELSGLCPFVVENKKDIDYEIKNALGRQGIVGLVMTPKATYAGPFEDKSLAWQIDELEVDIVENVTVNRGKKDGYVTGQDASMRLFDVMCPLSGENEGQFNPVSYQEGEDGNLLVNKCILKCLVHPEDPDAYTRYYADGQEHKVLWKGNVTKEMVDAEGLSAYNDVEMLFAYPVTSLDFQAFKDLSCLHAIYGFGSISAIGSGAFSNTGLYHIENFPAIETIMDNTFADCSALTEFDIPDGVKTIYAQAFSGCSSIDHLMIPASVTAIGYNAFSRMTNLRGIYFYGKTQEQLHDLKTWGNDNYSWGIEDTSKIHTEL